MTNKTLPKTVRGKRPQMFETQGLDYVMAMTLALAEEVSALRDRLDLVERVANDKGIVLANEIEGYALDEEALVERETRRQAYLARIFAVYSQELSEFDAIDSSEKHQDLLDEIAQL